MKTKHKYLFFFVLPFFALSQTAELALSKAHCTFFNGNVYSYGLTSRDKVTTLMIYRMDKDLKVIDSITINQGKTDINDYLQLNSDTLHDFLNIYLQRKEKKLVHVIRLNKLFKQVANIENVDIARLNSISAFESEIFYFRKHVYTVKISNSDTAGRQFYLNKYTLKSEEKNFEYDFKWQFPFEKKHINSAHIIRITGSYVLLYININQGPKTGQWILKVNATKGTLVHATKIGIKGDACFYSFGGICSDGGMTFILGQKFMAQDFSQEQNKLNITAKPFSVIYLAQVDSALEIISREEYKIPIIEPKGNKTANAYILRPYKLRKTETGFDFETDIYKGNNSGCFRYCNTLSNTLTLNEDKLVLNKTAITTNTLIEKFYFNNDMADFNGKLCSDSLSDFEKIYYKKIPLEVKVAFKTDEKLGAEWLLHKSDAKKGVETYALLKQGQLQKPDEISKSENPLITKISEVNCVLSRQLAEDKFQLKLFTW